MQTLRVIPRSQEKGNTPKLKGQADRSAMWGKWGMVGRSGEQRLMSGVRRVAHVSWHPHSEARRQGRLILPAKYRDELAGGLVITRFQERCLAIWPISAFVEVTKTARSASSSQQDVRDYQRMLASGASDETPDKQGRITIRLI